MATKPISLFYTVVGIGVAHRYESPILTLKSGPNPNTHRNSDPTLSLPCRCATLTPALRPLCRSVAPSQKEGGDW